MDYKSSGVNVEAGDSLVDWLALEDSQFSKNMPHADRIVSGIGGFASLFRIDFPEMSQPCLVTCTDGVGTKVKIASRYQKFEGIGQDLVAMCVNDLICTGGLPLLFLDYYATGELKLDHAKTFLTGVRRACFESDCALVGGETAEMPGVYQQNDFDCAGFAVGIVDSVNTLGAHKVRAEDVVIGISSSGFHSNGYSLLRKVFEVDMDNWHEDLLAPTALYVQFFKSLKKQCQIHAMAHITGGGIENIPRVLGDHKWKMKSWTWPDRFKEVQIRTGMTDDQMLKTLNCGVGLVVILDRNDQRITFDLAEKFGFQAYDLGKIE